MNFGLLGSSLGHTYSPTIHRHLGDYPYFLYEKQQEELENFLLHGDFTGLNVTIPYKEAVIPYCNFLSPVAAKLGAVNILVRQKDGKLVGHNSDYFGFETMLRKCRLQIRGKKVLVLGSGGASKTAVAVLENHGSKVVIISRSGENNYQNLYRHKDAAVIVNTTPVGMYPHNGISPVKLDQFPLLEGVLDVIYNPARTKLLLDAEKRGLVSMNGLLMLVAQAKEASEWFTGEQISDRKIDEIYHKLRLQMENIVLIGMPGCGKSTIGALVAEKTGKKFVDADACIAEKAGCTISEIFARHGEGYFRDLETQILTELGKQSGLVIATGGGCVTREENAELLQQNGQIFYIHRDIRLLATDGRPLSQSNALSEMYKIRKPLYDSFADFHIDNDDTPHKAVEQILHIWEGQK